MAAAAAVTDVALFNGVDLRTKIRRLNLASNCFYFMLKRISENKESYGENTFFAEAKQRLGEDFYIIRLIERVSFVYQKFFIVETEVEIETIKSIAMEKIAQRFVKDLSCIRDVKADCDLVKSRKRFLCDFDKSDLYPQRRIRMIKKILEIEEGFFKNILKDAEERHC